MGAHGPGATWALVKPDQDIVSASAQVRKAKSLMSGLNSFLLSSAKQRGHIQTVLRKYSSLIHAQMSPGRKMVGTGEDM